MCGKVAKKKVPNTMERYGKSKQRSCVHKPRSKKRYQTIQKNRKAHKNLQKNTFCVCAFLSWRIVRIIPVTKTTLLLLLLLLIAAMASSSTSTTAAAAAARRVIVVTGGNRGIGKALCQQLLEKYSDVQVIMASRSKSNGMVAANDILQNVFGINNNNSNNNNDRLEVVEMDTSSDESVKMAATEIAKKYSKLYAIVNNAGT